MTSPAIDIRPAIERCPSCGHRDFVPVHPVDRFQLVRCRNCSLQLINPQPSNTDLGEIYRSDYFIAGREVTDEHHVAALKQSTARHYLDLLADFQTPGRRLLEIGCGHGDFLHAAQQRGYDVTGVEYSSHACEVARARLQGAGRVVCGEIDVLDDQSEAYDFCVLCDVIEHVRRPDEFMHRVRRLLIPGGVVLIATPSLDSWSSHLLRSHWIEYKPEHLTYFSPATLGTLLSAAGFGEIRTRSGIKTLSLDYVAAHFHRYRVAGFSPLLAFLQRIAPRALRRHPFRIVASGMIVLARAGNVPEKR